MEALDIHIKDALGKRLDALEKYFKADVITIYGSLMPGVEKVLRNFLVRIKRRR